VSIIAIVVVAFVLATLLPEVLTRYQYHSVNEARSFGHIEGAEIIAEIGATNGPYRLVKGIVSGVGKPFDFDLKFNRGSTNWTRPISNHMWFVVTIFENRGGNQFAVIRKRTEQEMSKGQLREADNR